jgi:hypothetical protein
VLGYTPGQVLAGSPTVLVPDSPTVALTAVQSGIGALTVHAVCGDGVGDLRLACAYELHTGLSSIISDVSGLRIAPAGSRRPVVLAGRARYETLTVDLRQVTDLRRLVVVAFTPSGAVVPWGGALVVETLGGARVDVPLDHAPSAGVLVALSVLNVSGRLVLRAEHELVAGTLRDACTAYGFDRITWADPSTPLR